VDFRSLRSREAVLRQVGECHRQRAWRLASVVVVGTAVIIGAGGAKPAHAATTITVNTLSDEAITDGNCSLREAINNANTNTDTTGGDCVAGISGADTIDLSSLRGTITLGSDLPAISDDLTINGPGASMLTINANAKDYVLSVGVVRATIAGLTLTGASLDGALVNAGTVTVENSTISGNTESAGFNFSGGISNGSGTLTVENSTISNNRSLDSVFSGFGFGGGITNNGGTTNVANSVITGNSARFGGGIENRGTLTVESSTISGNSTSNDSGGIRNEGTATIERSTISGNSAGADFGGGITNGGTLTVENSTINGNSAGAFGSGGGIWSGQSAVLTVVSSTIAGNSAFVAGGIDNYAGTVTAKNTIFAANTGASPNCLFVSDGGYNLDDGSSCNFSTANNSLSNTDPLLDPAGLRNNGGPTQTIALEPRSPAIDAIPQGVNGCGTTITTDQRGVSRPQGSGCDIGAFELVKPGADLAITKSGAPNPVVSGNRLTYTLTVTNNGPQDATDVTVTDPLPDNVHFNSVASSQGSCSRSTTKPAPKDGTITCSLGNLANAAGASITIVVTTTTPGTLTNSATVVGNETDPNQSNNTATAKTTVIGT
jgi:uncharacterized repeat protein (TIGR01451 family)/CSLREA domain-containing protein